MTAYEDRQHTSTTRNPTPSTDFLNNAIAKFERGNQALAGQFLYYLLQTRPAENFMISGFSVLVALAQLTLNAVGVTLEQLMRVLNLDSKYEIEAVFPVLIQNYKAQKEVTFEQAVKYFSNINYPFTESFKKSSYMVFDADVQSLDFSKNVQAADTINNWVEDNTNGLIKDLVNANMFGQDTRCVLVNALYFLGNWEKQFDKDNTQPRDFYIDKDNTVSIDTMYQDGRFEYAESDDLDCQILKLPYKRGNFSFWVYLPKQRFGLQTMVEKLLKPDNFVKSMSLLSRKKVHVYLPVMDFDTNISNLPDLLRKVNITEPLKPYSNGFKGILENDEPLFISDAIQKTKIKVNEKGTEAAAATAIMVGATAAIYPPPEVYTVDCNHPFVFLLQLGNFPMFYGIYSGRS